MNDLALTKHQNPVECKPDHVLPQVFHQPQTVTTTLYQIVFGYCVLELKKTRSF